MLKNHIDLDSRDPSPNLTDRQTDTDRHPVTFIKGYKNRTIHLKSRFTSMKYGSTFSQYL